MLSSEWRRRRRQTLMCALLTSRGIFQRRSQRPKRIRFSLPESSFPHKNTRASCSFEWKLFILRIYANPPGRQLPFIWRGNAVNNWATTHRSGTDKIVLQLQRYVGTRLNPPVGSVCGAFGAPNNYPRSLLLKSHNIFFTVEAAPLLQNSDENLLLERASVFVCFCSNCFGTKLHACHTQEAIITHDRRFTLPGCAAK
jgi:hypothetical protein